MNGNKTKWSHHYVIEHALFMLRADFTDLEGNHQIVRINIMQEDLAKKGRLAVQLRKMQRAIYRRLAK